MRSINNFRSIWFYEVGSPPDWPEIITTFNIIEKPVPYLSFFKLIDHNLLLSISIRITVLFVWIRIIMRPATKDWTFKFIGKFRWSWLLLFICHNAELLLLLVLIFLIYLYFENSQHMWIKRTVTTTEPSSFCIFSLNIEVVWILTDTP